MNGFYAGQAKKLDQRCLMLGNVEDNGYRTICSNNLIYIKKYSHNKFYYVQIEYNLEIF